MALKPLPVQRQAAPSSECIRGVRLPDHARGAQRQARQKRQERRGIPTVASAVTERAAKQVASQPSSNGAAAPRLSADALSSSVAAVVLAGGSSSNPLAQYRALPSLELGSNLRLIDVPISNCIRSGINKLFVLTQWNSNALNQHIHLSFPPTTFGTAQARGFVDVLTANQTPRSTSWYRGSADAVRMNLENIMDPFAGEPVDDLLILSGNGLYDIDYSAVVAKHRAENADITVVSHPIPADKVGAVGILKIDPATGLVTQLAEKPKPEQVAGDDWQTGDPENPYLGSMGIYLFKREALERLLAEEPEAPPPKGAPPAPPGGSDVHFGYDVIPHALEGGYKVTSWMYDGFWAEIGSLKSFYDINLALAMPDAPLSVDAIHRGILSRGSFNPPAIISSCEIENTLVGDGCQLRFSKLTNTVLGRNTFVDVGCDISDSVLLGNSLYQNDKERQRLRMSGEAVVGLGKNVILRNAVLDTNVSIGNDVSITNMYGVKESDRADTGGFIIQDGIVVILQGSFILDGTRI